MFKPIKEGISDAQQKPVPDNGAETPDIKPVRIGFCYWRYYFVQSSIQAAGAAKGNSGGHAPQNFYYMWAFCVLRSGIPNKIPFLA